jgi:hypothetical protein
MSPSSHFGVPKNYFYQTVGVSVMASVVETDQTWRRRYLSSADQENVGLRLNQDGPARFTFKVDE